MFCQMYVCMDKETASQPVFACFKLTMETPEQ